MTVDLNTCVPGQKCVSKDGKYFTYLRKLPDNHRLLGDSSVMYHHLLLKEDSSEESFTNDGIYDVSHPDSKYDIVRILPMESTTPASQLTTMTVDLNTCVPGQKCIDIDGKYLTYLNKLTYNHPYHHLLLDEYSNEKTFTNDGIYEIGSLGTDNNIVRILPRKLTTSDKHPSIAWWESCPWITDRKPTEADADEFGRVLVKLTDTGRILTAFFQDGCTAEAWIHYGNWQPPVLSDKEKALELINKHEGVWAPTPDDWDVIRKGLTE